MGPHSGGYGSPGFLPGGGPGCGAVMGSQAESSLGPGWRGRSWESGGPRRAELAPALCSGPRRPGQQPAVCGGSGQRSQLSRPPCGGGSFLLCSRLRARCWPPSHYLGRFPCTCDLLAAPAAGVWPSARQASLPSRSVLCVSLPRVACRGTASFRNMAVLCSISDCCFYFSERVRVSGSAWSFRLYGVGSWSLPLAVRAPACVTSLRPALSHRPGPACLPGTRPWLQPPSPAQCLRCRIFATHPSPGCSPCVSLLYALLSTSKVRPRSFHPKSASLPVLPSVVHRAP